MSIHMLPALILRIKSLPLQIARVAVICAVLLFCPSDLSFVPTDRPAVVNPQQPAEDVGERPSTPPAGPQGLARQPLSHRAARVEGLTLGSQAVLEGLWTPQELQGSPHDTQLVRLRGPDHTPPAWQVPTQVAPPLAPGWRGSIRRVQPWHNQKVIALTFDLCERADDVTGYDAPIVHYLRTEQVRATFFAGGKWMRSHAEKAMQLMADPLFEVGNHSWTHGNLRVLQGEDLARQILWTQAQYELLWDELEHRARRLGIAPQEMEKIPRRPLAFRFPYGTCSPEALQALAASGLPAIQWDVVSGDPARHQTAPSIVKTVLSQTRAGSIVVFHANGRGHGTADALPRIIPALRAQGFEFVTVSELLRLGRVITAEECYELRPGDNRRYDAMVGEGTSRWR